MTENKNPPPAPAAAPAPAPVPAAQTPPQPDRRHQWLSALAFAAVALVGVLIVLYAWRLPPFTSPIVTTENATVRGQVTIIGTQLSGYVVEVTVQDFMDVKEGQLLVRIDDRIYQQRYEQAQAQLAAQQAALSNWAQQKASAQAGISVSEAALANAEAQARKASADLNRVEQLVADGSLSQREHDQSRATQAQMAAALAQARANLDIAQQSVIVDVVFDTNPTAMVLSARNHRWHGSE
jgi:multidrug resistance efflux pump